MKMDWDEFRLSLTAENIRIMDSMTTSRLEKCLAQWYTQIENAIDKHCPKRKNKPKDLNKPMVVKQITKPKKGNKNQNALWRTEARNRLLKEKIKTYKRDCLNAKKQDWRDFNTKQNSTESINILRKILERKKSNTLGVLEKTDRRHIYKPRARHT